MNIYLLLTSLLVFMTGVPFAHTEMSARDESVRIVAHRGAMADRPENTMAAFQRALELGADVVEVDVRTSSDGRLFVLHDSTLDRTTDGSGNPSDHTLQELRRLDAGSWFAPRYSFEIIPSLREVLKWGGDRTVILLDLKESGREFTEAVAAEIRATGNPDAVVIGVRSPEQAREFREVIPECRQLAFMRRPQLIEEFAEAGVDIIRLWLNRDGWLADNPELADRVRETGKKLMINGTLGALDEAKALMRFDPDWILIDDVAQLKESLLTLNQESRSR